MSGKKGGRVKREGLVVERKVRREEGKGGAH